MRSILVTGASGFIGRHLLRALTVGDNVVQIVNTSQGDISLSETWACLPSSDLVIHLAAQSSVPASWECPPDFVRTNCMGITYALEYCRRHQAKLIFLSSYMYGDAGSNPITENAPLTSKNPYALTKQFSEQLCELYSNNFEVETRILRPFNVYGPEQSNAFLIPKIVREAQTLGKVHVNDLNPRRDYVYVEDVVDAIMKLIDYIGPYRTFNIGTGQSHSVWEVIQMVQSLLRIPVMATSDDIRRPGEIMDSVANIELASRELGWVPRFSLSDGLARMISAS